MPESLEIFALSAHVEKGRSSRTFGWFPNEKMARHAAETNRGGMDEALYSWLCLEAVRPGVHGESRVVQWYSWKHPEGQEGRWVPSDGVPAWAVGVINFAMG